MQKEIKPIKVPKWPFLLGNLLLIVMAFYVAFFTNSGEGLSPVSLLIIFCYFLLGPVLFMAPFLLEHFSNKSMAKILQANAAQSLLEAMQKADDLAHWMQELEEATSSSIMGVRKIPERIEGKLGELLQAFERTGNEELESLREQVKQLRQADYTHLKEIAGIFSKAGEEIATAQAASESVVERANAALEASANLEAGNQQELLQLRKEAQTLRSLLFVQVRSTSDKIEQAITRMRQYATKIDAGVRKQQEILHKSQDLHKDIQPLVARAGAYEDGINKLNELESLDGLADKLKHFEEMLRVRTDRMDQVIREAIEQMRGESQGLFTESGANVDQKLSEFTSILKAELEGLSLTPDLSGIVDVLKTEIKIIQSEFGAVMQSDANLEAQLERFDSSATQRIQSLETQVSGAVSQLGAIQDQLSETKNSLQGLSQVVPSRHQEALQQALEAIRNTQKQTLTQIITPLAQTVEAAAKDAATRHSSITTEGLRELKQNLDELARQMEVTLSKERAQMASVLPIADIQSIRDNLLEQMQVLVERQESAQDTIEAVRAVLATQEAQQRELSHRLSLIMKEIGGPAFPSSDVKGDHTPTADDAQASTTRAIADDTRLDDESPDAESDLADEDSALALAYAGGVAPLSGSTIEVEPGTENETPPLHAAEDQAQEAADQPASAEPDRVVTDGESGDESETAGPARNANSEEESEPLATGLKDADDQPLVSQPDSGIPTISAEGDADIAEEADGLNFSSETEFEVAASEDDEDEDDQNLNADYYLRLAGEDVTLTADPDDIASNSEASNDDNDDESSTETDPLQKNPLVNQISESDSPYSKDLEGDDDSDFFDEEELASPQADLFLQAGGIRSAATSDAPPSNQSKGVKPTDISTGGTSSATTTSYTPGFSSIIVRSTILPDGGVLYIRGDGPGMSWSKGTPLHESETGLWHWNTTQPHGPFFFKVLLDDTIWCEGDDLKLEFGKTIEMQVSFS